MSEIKHTRINYIDIAKGLLIFLVIVDHLPDVFLSVLNGNSPLITIVDNNQWCFKCFFMPAFFMITGFCSSFDKPFRSFFINNFKTLIIPGVIFTIISILISSISHNSHIDILTYLRQIIKYGGNYWFLTSLFVSKCIYWILVKYIRKRYLISCILLLLVIIGFFASTFEAISRYDIWYWHYAFSLAIFIDFGHYLKRFDNKTSYKYIASLFFISIFLAYISGFKAPVVALNFHRSVYQIPFYLYFATTGTIMTLYVSQLIGSSRILQYMGRMSLVLYVLQIDVVTIVESLFLRFFNIDTSLNTVCFFLFSLFGSLSILLLSGRILNSKFLKWTMGKF